MHGLRACIYGRLQDTLPLQVAILGRTAAHMHGLVTHLHMFAVRICIGIHRNRLNTHALGGGGYAASNFTAVGYQDFVKHVVYLRPTNWVGVCSRTIAGLLCLQHSRECLQYVWRFRRAMFLYWERWQHRAPIACISERLGDHWPSID